MRCKFRLDNINRCIGQYPTGEVDPKTGRQIYGPRELHTVIMSPVYGNGDPEHENTKYWAASPSGRLEIGTVNASAVAHLQLGAEYYIDVIPAS